MKGMLIPTNGNPVEIDIKVDEEGSTLHDLQRLVGGNIEPFDVIFGEGISLYVNEEGLFTCPPNRAVYATKGMEEAGYLSMMVSMMDYGSPVKEGELYSILCGDLVAVGFDFETGENRDLSADEMSRVADYFTEVSKPGSGIEEVIAIRMGQHREEARSEDGRVTLKGELRHRVPPPRSWQRDATSAPRHATTTPSCRYIESHHGRKVGKHHGIRQEHPRRAATAAPRPR